MAERFAESITLPRARVIGLVYLLYFLVALSTVMLSSRPRLSLAANLLSIALYIVLTVLFYYLFRAVNRSLSLVSMFFSLAGCAIQTLGLFHLVSDRISPLLFFGPYCLLIGYLILRSIFLPRILGVLMVLAGFGWLTFLWPLAAKHLSQYIEVVGFLGELSVALWLLVAGVNVQRWKEQASAAGTRM